MTLCEASAMVNSDIDQSSVIKFLDMSALIGASSGFQEHLLRIGFLAAPASIGHHGAYTGGLFDHSYRVAENLLMLTERLDLKWKDPHSPVRIGLFHDLCKLEAYQNTSAGEWKYQNDSFLPGHGEKSVIMLQQFMSLTEEELLCIRWHMGAFDDKANWDYYTRAIQQYPNVLFTHMADMMASQVDGI